MKCKTNLKYIFSVCMQVGTNGTHKSFMWAGGVGREGLGGGPSGPYLATGGVVYVLPELRTPAGSLGPTSGPSDRERQSNHRGCGCEDLRPRITGNFPSQRPDRREISELIRDDPTTTTTIFGFISRGPIFHFWGTPR